MGISAEKRKKNKRERRKLELKTDSMREESPPN